MAFLIGGTFCLIPQLGREFMPELEEGNLWLRGIGELNMNLEHSIAIAKRRGPSWPATPRWIRSSPRAAVPTTGPTPRVSTAVSTSSPCGRQEDWPKVVQATGWRRWIFGPLAADEARARQ